MSNKEKNLTEKVIDINSEEKEIHKCEKCDAEAIIYDSDLKMWLCESCKNEEDELEKIALKMEKKLSKRPYTFDLKELLEGLSKDEIYNIARNLGIGKISNLNKDKLVEKLVTEYKEAMEKRLDLFEEERYLILKEYIDNKGVKLFDDISEEEAEKSAYFIQQGLLYPAVKNDKSLFLMPKVVQNILKKKNEIEYRRLLKTNSEIINIYRGMNKAYGVLDIKEAIALLKLYVEVDSDNIEDMLKEAAYYYNEYREESGYFINNEINDYEEILKDIEKEEVSEYAFISKDELLSMTEENWVFNSRAGKSFYKEFTSIFSVDKDMTAAMMDDLSLDVQEYEPKEAVEKMIELIKIDNEEAKFVAAAMMNKFVNKLRLWRYKGASTNDFKSSKVTAKAEKVIGRNDPCICGSGKKYKKCCGKNK